MFEITIARIECFPLSVPLRESFVIATADIAATCSALVRVTLASGETGIGEAAALPGVTSETQASVLAELTASISDLSGARFAVLDQLPHFLAQLLPRSPVGRAGLEAAILDAWGRAVGRPVSALLNMQNTEEAVSLSLARKPLITDVTLPIGAPEHMASLAIAWSRRGFRVFKVKVGRALDDDVRALSAIAAAVPHARFRIDANGGYSAREAVRLIEAMKRGGLVVECFEQPCARDDLVGMAEITAFAPDIPVVADESVQDDADLEAVVALRAAAGINLKLAKMGSLVLARRLAARARDAGLRLMCGAMVETRLGLSAMAHVVAALGGVEWVDLDTALLLADDPFEGGYDMRGDELFLKGGVGLDVRIRADSDLARVTG